MDSRASAILEFWFGKPGDTDYGQAREMWFRKDAAADAAIRDAFGEQVAIALAGGFGEWCATAPGALARVLLLDQFTRNMFRDTPRAFAGDARALATAQDAVARGLDQALDAHGRWFVYMPFEHAEDADMQRESLRLFSALAQEMDDPSPLEWARKHAEVIFRFGRYPHRNAILGRESTAAEIEYLSQPGSRF